MDTADHNADRWEDTRGGLIRQIRRTLKRERKKLEKMRLELDEAARAGEYTKFGDTLQVHFAAIKSGTRMAELPDPEDPARILRIPLNPPKRLQNDIAGYYHLAKKMESRTRELPPRLAVVEQEINALTARLERLETVGSEADLRELQRNDPAVRPTSPKDILPPHERERIKRVREFKTSTGWTVWVGKRDQDNDYLTTRLARPWDWWFHAMGAPGSHVVLRSPDRHTVPDAVTVRETAAIAAFYSKLKKAKEAPVQYTQKKFVRKPKKAKTGLVVIEREKTVFAVPGVPGKDNGNGKHSNNKQSNGK